MDENVWNDNPMSSHWDSAESNHLAMVKIRFLPCYPPPPPPPPTQLSGSQVLRVSKYLRINKNIHTEKGESKF